MTTNLVCYPRINLVYPSVTPPPSAHRLLPSVESLTRQVFDPANRLIDMHGVENKIAVGLYYRGDIAPFEAHQSLAALK
jgi:hypothetical protein